MLGKLGFGFMYASFNEDPDSVRARTIAALHYAMDQGIVLFDTADTYAPSWDTMGHNELVLAEAVRTYPGDTSKLVLATKAGITRSAGEVWGRNSSFDYLARAAEASANRLGVTKIPLWQHHRLDPNLPFEAQLENLAKLRETGIFEHLGVSNYSASQLERAIEVAGPILTVQNQLNPHYRQQLDVLSVCEAHGITYLPWSPTKGARGKDASPVVAEIAARQGVSPYAVAIAWLRQTSPAIVPIPGVTRRESVEDSLSALNLNLAAEELESINSQESAPMDKELLSDQPKN